MRGQQQVYDYLEQQGIGFDYYEHPEAPTIEIASQFYRGEGTVLCKNLFFRNHKGNKHYLVIMDARHNMDIHEIEHQLHQGKLSFASPEDMLKYLDIEPGAVSIMGLMNDKDHAVQLLIDEDVLKDEYIGCHPCVNTSSLKLKTEDVINKFLPAAGHDYKTVHLVGED